MQSIDIINIVKKGSLILILFSFVGAQTIELNKKIITIKRHEVLIEVRGLVCSFCAMGLQGGLSSLKNIEPNKFNAGVFVDVEHQYVIIAEKDNYYINIEEVLEMITGSGYEVASIYTNRTGEKIEIWNVNTKE